MAKKNKKIVEDKKIQKGDTLETVKMEDVFDDLKTKKKLKVKKQEEVEKLGEKERVEVIKKFTKEALKKYGNLIRSVVLFGSTARKEFKEESDIDIFVIIDDTKTKISPRMKIEIEDYLDLLARKTSKQLSLQQPYLLTEFWRLVREGHPIILNFIREGVPVYDKDIFLPIKKLLQMGEIKPSKEAVEKFIERGPKRIRRVENAKIYMVVEDCYYAMLESAQAVLMFLGKMPPRPSDAPKEIRRSLVEKKLLDEKFVDYLEGVIKVRKDVEHKKLKSISGIELDKWIKKTKEFVKEMQKLIVKIEILKRENIVLKSHAIMTETAMTLLKAMKKKVTDETLPEKFKKELVDAGIINENYLNVYKRLSEMKELVNKGKIMEIPKQEILLHREYVRKFIREAGKVMKKKINMNHE
jgi:predicted nucleotidyltransferase